MTSMTTDPATSSAPQAAPTCVPITEPMIWVNGHMVPKSQATVSVFDHGLLYGDGIFEGIRIYNGKIFKLEQHMDRLYNCADRIFLDIGVSREKMIRIQRECVAANNIKNGYIRLVITRGEGTLGLNPYHCPKAGVICIADTIALFTPEMYESGMRVVLANRPKTPIECLDPRIKTLNYLNNIMAKIEVRNAGAHEGIMLNLQGFVAEATGENIFIYREGKLLTPPVWAGALPGITRAVVMELARREGIPVVEALFTPYELYTADECFLTGTAAEIVPVVKVDGRPIGTGRPGPITRRLTESFHELTRKEGVPFR